ncbi:MAG: exo-beta-N-acetylmuramidase NamZ domain-containing protein, partial [Acidobacteriota bacterium]
MKRKSFLVATIWLVTLQLALAQTPPERVGMRSSQLAYIDVEVAAEIAKNQLPGAVVVVSRQGQIVWRRAYGNRALQPTTEAMTSDTVFDLASLTKVVATATSIMILVERGRVRLGDPVSRYIPEFAAAGKKNITVEQLLTHRSGFIPDNEVRDYEAGAEKALENIWALAPIAEAGSRFIYSDVNFIVLGELVRRLSGQTLDQFAAENIFSPLGMKDTGFKPHASLRGRMAPTEKRGGSVTVPSTGEKTGGDEHWMRGEVHDPRSYLMGGVAGHAGLFSTADDLAKYCQMILNGGEYAGTRILSPLGVARMTEARVSGGNASDGFARGLGWDIATTFSANRGDLFPIGSFGHTGFTGTSIWMDPESETFVVFLSNRVHPRLDPKQPADVGSLRGRVSSIVAASIIAPPYSNRRGVPQGPSGPGPEKRASSLATLNGIDVLVRDNFAMFRGKRVGLITNHTGKDRLGRSTIDLLFAAPEVKLVALFSPEHGLRGLLDQEKIASSIDEKTKLPINSLYGETRQPTAEMLKNLDVLVYDIQDVGTRFYTYISTLGLAMEAAAKQRVKFVVLDRANPINGIDVEGPIADEDKLSFIAYHRLPVRHGMTVGELAQLFNEERRIGADLEVVRLLDWRRDAWFDETGLTWINPSPNMRSLTEATLYPGIGLLETTNVSVGRGTDTPFEVVGAPWMDGTKLSTALNAKRLPGVRFVSVRFTPRSSVHESKECGGINIIITDRSAFEPISTGLEIAHQLLSLFPKEFLPERFIRLLANRQVFEALTRGSEGRALRQLWETDLADFRAVRRKYLLY